MVVREGACALGGGREWGLHAAGGRSCTALACRPTAFASTGSTGSGRGCFPFLSLVCSGVDRLFGARQM